jgi:hypothetical protein
LGRAHASAALADGVVGFGFPAVWRPKPQRTPRPRRPIEKIHRVDAARALGHDPRRDVQRATVVVVVAGVLGGPVRAFD